MNTFTTKLGTTKGLERGRIWIEGARLVAAGFTVGTLYMLIRDDDARIWSLETISPEDVGNTRPRKVSGKGEKPIIDITGKDVAFVFGSTVTHVDVTYWQGRITLRESNTATHHRAA